MVVPSQGDVGSGGRRRTRGGGAGVPVRREFQFPGDLWLPRRENRCRQPPNNHTSYDYHTPGVYTYASYPRLSFVLSPSLPRTHVCPPPRSPPWPTFFISTCLITNSQAHLYPLRLRKIARDLNYCALLLFLSHYLRRSNYYPPFRRPRFKLSRELRIIIY